MTAERFIRPASWAEALEARTARSEAVPVAGGTDVLVELNFDRLHPEAIMDLTGLEELRAIDRQDGVVRIGSGVTYERLIAALPRELPALAAASRSVGSPPIRNRGTIGGNLGSASPAGDCHPTLLACKAEVELASAGTSRTVGIDDFFLGPKRSALRPSELIAAVRVPRADGPQAFAKVGTRNAMVIAVCSFSLALHPMTASVGTGIGSAGPVPLRAVAAEEFLAGHLEEAGAWESRAPLAESARDRFAALVAEAARPIDDVRGRADYRRHALGVLARRTLSWCWDEYRAGGFGEPG